MCVHVHVYSFFGAMVEVLTRSELRKHPRPYVMTDMLCMQPHLNLFCMQDQWTLARKSHRRVGMMMIGVQIGEELGATWPAL